MAEHDMAVDRLAQVAQIRVMEGRHRILVHDRFPVVFVLALAARLLRGRTGRSARGEGAVLGGDGAVPTDAESVDVGEAVGRLAVVAGLVSRIMLPQFRDVVVVDCP